MNSPAKIRKGELILKPKSSAKKGTNIRAAVVASQYHKPIVEKLVEGAVRGFTQKGVSNGAGFLPVEKKLLNFFLLTSSTHH